MQNKQEKIVANNKSAYHNYFVEEVTFYILEEIKRVLKPNGILIFKWNETDIPVSKILELTDRKAVFGHISGKRSNTHWICFIKD